MRTGLLNQGICITMLIVPAIYLQMPMLVRASDPTPTEAQVTELDGTYMGTIRCGLLSHLKQPLRTSFAMTVSGSEATYERPILKEGEPTGSFERGRGTLSSSGEVTLRGQCGGNFSCDGQYKGQLNVNPIRLAGTQRWRLGRKTEERSCQLDLARTPPKP